MIRSAFAQYISPSLVEQLARNPEKLKLGGETKELTILFSDVRDFTRLAEGYKTNPQGLTVLVNRLLTPLSRAIVNQNGTIDKYMGDNVMAFWNAPLDDPQQYENAARAALAMSAKLRELNQRNGADWPGQIGIGIGLNAGPCCVGNMGSAQRLSYSLIGDTVNLASRIEGLTKFYGVEIAIGAALHAELGQFACLELDRVRVVGRHTPEVVHALLGDEAMAASEDFSDFSAQYSQMLSAYRSREWQGAANIADALAVQADARSLGRVVAIYQERIAGFSATPPPPDWDGVFESVSK